MYASRSATTVHAGSYATVLFQKLGPLLLQYFRSIAWANYTLARIFGPVTRAIATVRVFLFEGYPNIEQA